MALLTEIPVGLDMIIDTFGSVDDSDFESKHIVSFTLPYTLFYAGKPVNKSRCHALIVENVQKMFEDIRAAGFADQVKNYSGMYAKRAIRGRSSHPSTHSWGIAIDLEADKYPLGSLNRFPPEIVQVFRSAGGFYGGDFKSRKDPMHVQWAQAY